MDAVQNDDALTLQDLFCNGVNLTSVYYEVSICGYSYS